MGTYVVFDVIWESHNGARAGNGIGRHPNYGDMRSVRPMIRASEIGFSDEFEDGRDWANKFWQQCLFDTPCHPLSSNTPLKPIIGTTPNRVAEVYEFLVQHSPHKPYINHRCSA